MEILKFKAEHLEKVKMLSDDLFNDGWTITQFENELKDDNAQSVVLIENSVLIGFLFAKVICDDMEILNVGIHKEYQGKGYGKKLMEYILNFADVQNIKNVFLEVNDKNEKAKGLYLSFGFEENRRRKKYYGEEDGLELIKKIDKSN